MKSFIRASFVAALSLAVAASPALACSVCGCGDPLVGVGQKLNGIQTIGPVVTAGLRYELF